MKIDKANVCFCNHPCMSHYLDVSLITPKDKHSCSINYPSPINWPSLRRKGQLVVLLKVHLDQNSTDATRGCLDIFCSVFGAVVSEPKTNYWLVGLDDPPT